MAVNHEDKNTLANVKCTSNGDFVLAWGALRIKDSHSGAFTYIAEYKSRYNNKHA